MWDVFEARLHEIYLCVQDVCRPSMWGHKPVQLSSSNSATMFGCCSFSKWLRIYSPHRLENYIIGKPDHIGKLDLLLSLMYVGHCWEQFSCPSSLKLCGCLNCMGDAGEYLGLTGTRLNGAEMLSCGLATHFVPSQVWLHFTVPVIDSFLQITSQVCHYHSWTVCLCECLQRDRAAHCTHTVFGFLEHLLRFCWIGGLLSLYSQHLWVTFCDSLSSSKFSGGSDWLIWRSVLGLSTPQMQRLWEQLLMSSVMLSILEKRALCTGTDDACVHLHFPLMKCCRISSIHKGSFFELRLCLTPCTVGQIQNNLWTFNCNSQESYWVRSWWQ